MVLSWRSLSSSTRPSSINNIIDEMEFCEIEAVFLFLGCLSLVYLWTLVLLGPRECLPANRLETESHDLLAESTRPPIPGDKPLPLASNPQVAESSTSLKRLNFNSLPPELRIMILKCCDLSWRPRCVADGDPDRCTAMPAILIALRSQKDSTDYFEALKLFYQQNTYAIASGNGYGFGWMRPNAILKIQMASIAFGSFAPVFVPCAEYSSGFKYLPSKFQQLPVARLNPKILEIDLYHDDNRSISGDVMDLWLLQSCFPRCLTNFTSLKRVSLEFINRYRCRNPNQNYSSRNDRMMDEYGNQVGGQTVLLSFEQRNEFPGISSTCWYETWEWTAQKGDVMRWSEWTMLDFIKLEMKADRSLPT